MKPENIKILGAISLDNKFTREYISSMKDFHKTFKPLASNSIIQEQFKSSNVDDSNKSDINNINKNDRKTRKQKK